MRRLLLIIVPAVMLVLMAGLYLSFLRFQHRARAAAEDELVRKVTACQDVVDSAYDDGYASLPFVSPSDPPWRAASIKHLRSEMEEKLVGIKIAGRNACYHEFSVETRDSLKDWLGLHDGIKARLGIDSWESWSSP